VPVRTSADFQTSGTYTQLPSAVECLTTTIAQKPEGAVSIDEVWPGEHCWLQPTFLTIVCDDEPTWASLGGSGTVQCCPCFEVPPVAPEKLATVPLEGIAVCLISYTETAAAGPPTASKRSSACHAKDGPFAAASRSTSLQTPQPSITMHRLILDPTKPGIIAANRWYNIVALRKHETAAC
jgi:hypothetical protein